MPTTGVSEQQLLKDAIIQRLAGIDDVVLLDAFLTLAEKYHTPKPLSAEQLHDVETGRRQIASGEWISHEDFVRELDEEFPDNEG